ncbi:MAG TPA: hypothetical protein VN708_02280 [Terriglobales bacterium]|jgi:hypothetical protein|nr:hypothetical protein [Terriglobales bacterium]
MNADARYCNACGKPANIATLSIPRDTSAGETIALPMEAHSVVPSPTAAGAGAHFSRKRIRRSRPKGAIVLAVFASLGAAAMASLSMVLFSYAASARGEGALAPMRLLMNLFPVLAKGQQDMVNQASEAGTAMFIIAAFCAVLSYGMWTLRKWGRIVAIVFSVLMSIRAMILIVNSYDALLWNLFVIAISIWIIMYLMKPRVKQAFGA